MRDALNSRTKEAWLAALRGQDSSDDAVEALRDYLHRALHKILRSTSSSEDDIADFVQDTMVKLVEYAHTFRGESSFTTWATAVATRVAFTELRRRRARPTTQEAFEQILDQADALPSTLDTIAQRTVFEALSTAIETDLTRRQRIAIVAELQEIPTVEVAERLGITQNALYKLTHDARKKLRTVLVHAGFTADHILEETGGKRA